MSTCFDPSVSTATYMNIYIYICVYIYWFEYILNRFTYSSPSPVSHVVCARDCSMSCGPLCSLVERVFKRLSVLQHWLPFQLAGVSLLRRTSTKKKVRETNRWVETLLCGSVAVVIVVHFVWQALPCLKQLLFMAICLKQTCQTVLLLPPCLFVANIVPQSPEREEA